MAKKQLRRTLTNAFINRNLVEMWSVNNPSSIDSRKRSIGSIVSAFYSKDYPDSSVMCDNMRKDLHKVYDMSEKSGLMVYIEYGFEKNNSIDPLHAATVHVVSANTPQTVNHDLGIFTISPKYGMKTYYASRGKLSMNIYLNDDIDDMA